MYKRMMTYLYIVCLSMSAVTMLHAAAYDGDFFSDDSLLNVQNFQKKEDQRRSLMVAQQEHAALKDPQYLREQRAMAERVEAHDFEDDLSPQVAVDKVRIINNTGDIIRIPYHLAQQTSEFWRQEGFGDNGVFVILRPTQVYDAALAGRNAKESVDSAKLFNVTVYGGHSYLLTKEGRDISVQERYRRRKRDKWRDNIRRAFK